ncbi:type II secretion system F family protein [Candidatus Bathyarchaeota archaeon]|nr:type II secretion system F family protein [Candidatus Bathyarchaeota archaeon]
MDFRDFCYSHFEWIGKKLTAIFHGVEQDLDAAYMKIHPEVYFSIVSFIAFLSLTIPFTLFLLKFIGLLPESQLISMIISFSTIIPLIVVVFGRILPKMVASNRISSLKIEIPYASMYISVMTSGGLSPYESLLRLRHTDLLPQMRKEVTRIEAIVKSSGVDPVSAMEKAAKVVNLNDYKELLLGYASSVRTGGDTLHYLYNQTDNMFKRFSTRIKSMGETMGALMEGYTIIGILGVLGLFLMFIIGVSLPSMGSSFSAESFFLFAFIGLPIISLVFIYFIDVMQINYPLSNMKPYLFLYAFLPIGIILASQLVLPFFAEGFLLFPPAQSFIVFIRKILNLAEGTEAPLGLAITLIIIAIPGIYFDHHYAQKEGDLQNGISKFLRDLVETRKGGLSPEKCIESLSSRDYRGFSSHLKRMSLKLSWGNSFRSIYEEFGKSVKNWLALINVYLLIDTIEVGGGTEGSLETLAEFSESSRNLENEKRSLLMPLLIVPYMGGGMLIATTVMFLQFFTALPGLSIQYVTLYRILLTPLILHCFLLGIVTGKVVSGRASSGFKHALFMLIVAIGGMWAVSNLSSGLGGFS